MSSSATEHPSPHRGRIGLVSQLFCLAAPPIAWTAHLTANFIIVDRRCFPDSVALAGLPVERDSPLFAYGPSAIALLVCLISVAIAYGNWRRTRDEKAGPRERLVDVGEGRSRFMALCGVLFGVGFAVATIFDSLFLFGGRTCGS
jgi:hypothetical protein